MPSYSNGYIPDSLLVTFKTGWNNTDGNWAHKLSPSSYVKHQALVNLARQNTGRTLEITEGWGAYRPYDIQVLARKMYGYGAATPGQSSHGGFWEGKQTLAMDYGNWSWVYGGDRAAFYRDVYACGLTPGLIHPSRGNNYPDEPWHVVDLAPWQPVAAGTGKTSTPLDFQEEDMYVVYIQGMAGKFIGGQFAFMRDNAGKWFGKRLTKGGDVPAGMPTMDHAQITSWQNTLVLHDA